MDNDEMLFLDEDESTPASSASARPWRILVVDDDADVHDATRLVLANTLILDRPLHLLHARSAREARACLAAEGDIAAILLDVVMEEDDAGLRLVDYIRRELKLEEVRIILRTGQPGHAPELEAIRDYDINDYKTKTELTRHKLYTTLTTALRSYEQIRSINASRRGLEMIINACQRLTAECGLQSFAAGVITQLSGMLGLPPEGLICARCMGEEGEPEYQIVAAAGRHAALVCRPLNSITDEQVRHRLGEALSTRQSYFSAQHSVLFFSGERGKDMAAYVDAGAAVSAADRGLLEMFCCNVGRCLDNIDLFERLNRRIHFDDWLHMASRAGLCDALLEAAASGHEQELLLISFAPDSPLSSQPETVLLEVSKRLRAFARGRGLAAYLAPHHFALLAPVGTVLPAELEALLAEADGRSLKVSVRRMSPLVFTDDPEPALVAAEMSL